MKNLLLLCLLSMAMLASAFTTIDDATTSDESTYYVLANSGLKMRETPNLKGKKITTISYGTAIQVLDDGKSYGTLTVTEFEGYNIKGDWVKVSHKGQTGYVFNGYLTQLPVPEKKTYIFDYLKEDLKLSKAKYDKKRVKDCVEMPDKDCYCNWKENYYNDKVLVHKNNCNDPGDHFYYTFIGLTQHEIYLIMKQIYSGENYHSYYNKETDTVSIEYEDEEMNGVEVVTIEKTKDGKTLAYYVMSC